MSCFFFQGEKGLTGPPGPPGRSEEHEGAGTTINIPGPPVWYHQYYYVCFKCPDTWGLHFFYLSYIVQCSMCLAYFLG